MSISWLEDLMYQISGLFLAPVLLLLVFLFAYSLVVLGACAMQSWLRYRDAEVFRSWLSASQSRSDRVDKEVRKPAGFPLLVIYAENPTVNTDELDVAALKELEGVRLVSRIAPMLGLIATMVPMGPALKSLSNGNIQGISENLIVAFAAVIFGLVIASITFWVATVKKRWLATELVALSKIMDKSTLSVDSPREQPKPKSEMFGALDFTPSVESDSTLTEQH